MVSITFVHRGTEAMASFRYRCLIPGAELEKHGHTVAYNGGNAHICIFSKPEPEDIFIAKQVRDNHSIVVVDIGDDHFNHPSIGPVYQTLLPLADFVVCPTEIMKTRLEQFTPVNITVIGDPYEMAENDPHADGDKLLWFGHEVNREDIESYRKLENLHIVIGPNKFDDCTLWSPEAVKDALWGANKVLLPTRQGSEYKSPNRLVNSLRAGCFPICDPHPAYKEFENFAWTGGVRTGLKWARHFQSDLCELVAMGQAYVEKNYSPAVIGNKWAEFVDCI